jgi:hypothetical protein
VRCVTARRQAHHKAAACSSSGSRVSASSINAGGRSSAGAHVGGALHAWFVSECIGILLSCHRLDWAHSVSQVSDGDAEGLRLHVRASSKPATAGLQGTTAAAAPAAVTTGGFKQTTVDEATQAVKVSLADCLACSGCVTSAETVLLQHQSLKEFAAKCADPDVNVVVTVSPQSRAALAGVLCCAVLCCAVLCCAVLCCAVLCCAVLRCAVLRCAALCCAALCCQAACPTHTWGKAHCDSPHHRLPQHTQSYTGHMQHVVDHKP